MATSGSSRRLALVVVAALGAAALVWLLFLRGHGASPAAPAAPPTASGDDPWARPAPTAAHPDQPAATPTAPRFLRDADPPGGLRLEGQVLDDKDQPVAGAEVWLGSVPPRTTRSEDDGSFSFDKLVGRTYEVAARAGDRVGGPLSYTLTATSDPAVLRLRAGETVAVIVTAAADGMPIAGADVAALAEPEQHATTGPDGRAELHGIGAGTIALGVTAAGFAPSHSIAQITEGANELRVQLARGAAVSGKVVDEAGAPVAKAHVIGRDAGNLLDFADATREGVTTDDAGRFTIPAVPAGTFRFLATDDVHAPGSTAPLSVDGATPRTDVTITMKAAAVLAGRVVTKDKQPAAYATVRVAPKERGVGGDFDAMQAASRQIVADQDGKFTLRGLPRGSVRVRAENDAAASAIVDVDLTAGAGPADLVLVLDVSGTIAGVVVDATGQPVAEAQVSAMLDVLGGGGAANDLELAGFSQTTTDGGGHFAVHGLPPGGYRLWAHRGATANAMGEWRTQGTPAKTGDTGVKIVLPAPGGIKGKLALDDGSAVKVAFVQTGFSPSVAARGGAFELTDLAPGGYDVRIHGPDFAEITRGDVVVEAGKTTDLGTITVRRGRRVTGRVTTADGTPAPGARVQAGAFLISDGKQLGLQTSGDNEGQRGLRTTTTDGDGNFALIGVGPDEITLVADHDTLGRSDDVTVPAGTVDPAPLALRLRGVGSLAGKVTASGQPVGGAAITATAKTGGSHAIVVTTGADGTYVIDRIPEGAFHLTVVRTSGFGASTAGVDATVVAGKQTTADIDIPVGDIALTVEIHGLAGAEVDAAQIFLFNGNVAARNGKDLQGLFLKSGASGGMKFWLGGGNFPTFDALRPGLYSVCTIPITGSLSDPQLMQRIQAAAATLDVYCVAHTLPASPNQQRFVQEVPAMKALPAPK